jgi:diaminopimelate decarboxylase
MTFDEGATAAVGSHLDAFHRLEQQKGHLAIGEVRLADIAARYGTPLYVLDGDSLMRQIAALQQQLAAPNILLSYSIKANASLQILVRCLEAGLGLDACSPGDVLLALAAGARPEDVSYTGVGLSESQIGELAAAGVHLNLDSQVEVRRFAAAARGKRVGLRIAPDIEAGFHPHCRSGPWGGKFGLDPIEVADAGRVLRAASCALTTLHTHLGSSIPRPEPFLAALDFLLGLASDLPEVDRINLGGGLAARYHPNDPPFALSELRKGIDERLARFAERHGRQLTAELEPGEMFVSECGYLLCAVSVVKHWQRAGQELRVAITDGSMNLLPAHSLYGTYNEVYVDGKPLLHHELFPYDLFGCTNQTGDRLAVGRSLPELAEGDLLVLRNAGAYGYCRSTRFNERPRPGELWIEDGRTWLVRQPESLEHLTNGQHFLRR